MKKQLTVHLADRSRAEGSLARGDRRFVGRVSVGTCAVTGAVAGLLLSVAARIPNPFIAVLTLSVVGALIGYGAGERTINGTLTLRLLLAGVWLSVGVSDPTPLGLIAVVFGAGFAVLAIADARRAVRLERARARLERIRNSR